MRSLRPATSGVSERPTTDGSKTVWLSSCTSVAATESTSPAFSASPLMWMMNAGGPSPAVPRCV